MSTDLAISQKISSNVEKITNALIEGDGIAIDIDNLNVDVHTLEQNTANIKNLTDTQVSQLTSLLEKTDTINARLNTNSPIESGIAGIQNTINSQIDPTVSDTIAYNINEIKESSAEISDDIKSGIYNENEDAYLDLINTATQECKDQLTTVSAATEHDNDSTIKTLLIRSKKKIDDTKQELSNKLVNLINRDYVEADMYNLLLTQILAAILGKQTSELTPQELYFWRETFENYINSDTYDPVLRERAINFLRRFSPIKDILVKIDDSINEFKLEITDKINTLETKIDTVNDKLDQLIHVFITEE